MAAEDDLIAACQELMKLDWCIGYELGGEENHRALDRAVEMATDALVRRGLLPGGPRRPGVVTYACGYQDGRPGHEESYGMFAGPVPELEVMLDVVPDEDRTAYLFRFDPDGTSEKLYRWSRKRRAWKKMRGTDDK